MEKEPQYHKDGFNLSVTNPGRRRFIKLGVFAVLGLAGAMIPGCSCEIDSSSGTRKDSGFGTTDDVPYNPQNPGGYIIEKSFRDRQKSH